MVGRLRHVAALAYGLCLLAWGKEAQATPPLCNEALLRHPVAENAAAGMSASMLAELVDIGQGEIGTWLPSPLSVSPDGDQLAFQLRRAMPQSNSYCLGIFVFDLRHRSLMSLDIGGDLITGTMSLRGLAAVPLGTPAVIVPAWSPDGRWLAYLRRDNGVTQVWRARADGGGAEQVTTSPFDVEDLVWSTDGSRISYATRPDLARVKREIDQEGMSGYHFDHRFSPMLASRPQPAEPIHRIWSEIDVAARSVQSGADRRNDTMSHSAGSPAFVDRLPRRSPTGLSASVVASANLLMAPSTIAVTADNGASIECPESLCLNALDLWWADDGATLWFLRREGQAANRMALYAWPIGKDRPARFYSTDGVLTGCRMIHGGLICLLEASNSPGRIVEIRPDRQRPDILFDPNPQIGKVRLGSIQRLFARTVFGVEAFGDLVLPPDHRLGQRHPLVVVQYSSRGFLRGGTGDEFPIQPLAAEGFAVLSFQRPKDYVAQDARHLSDLTHAEQKDWADRRNVQSALDGLIDRAVATGVVNPRRIGLTGLSDGASTTQFALLNGRTHFSAVALASCCEDEATFTVMGGPALADGRKASGYPAWGDVIDPWAKYSLSRNAARLDVPILMQLADSEYLLSLETVNALNADGPMVDLFVYPDERHIKWQPAHRLAIYRRNIEWFRFWLRDAPSIADGGGNQLAQWQAIRRSVKARSTLDCPSRPSFEPTLPRP